MSDAEMMRQRWEARRKKIADDFFAGDEANAETVLDALPYSTIPDWGDVALLMQSMGAAGLLAKYPHLEVDGDWLIEAVNEHTCGAGPGSGAGHEPGCGTIPVGRLLTPEVEAKIAARAWDEGYGTGVADERTAADYNAGSPFAGVSPARINPYEHEGGASDADA